MDQNPGFCKKNEEKKSGQRLVSCTVMPGWVFRDIFKNMHPKLLAKLC